MENVRNSVAAQSAALSQAADEILAEAKVEPRRFVPLSSAEAVLRYWSDFIPSWAGAISIDLLPVVLVLVLMIVNDAMRKESQSATEADTMTAAEMLRAMSLYRQMTREPGPEAADIAVAEAATAPPPEPAKDGPDATVTPIELGRGKRTDTPGRS